MVGNSCTSILAGSGWLDEAEGYQGAENETRGFEFGKGPFIKCRKIRGQTFRSLALRTGLMRKPGGRSHSDFHIHA
jgi:hypothetical protein